MIHITVITADTFGLAQDQLGGIEEVKLVIIGASEDGTAKANYVQACWAQRVIAIGNGVNDRQMFEAAGLAICVIGKEGASVKSLMSADVVVTEIEDAIGLLLNTRGLIATLRR
jgi:soluble P-type ATPase